MYHNGVYYAVLLFRNKVFYSYSEYISRLQYKNLHVKNTGISFSWYSESESNDSKAINKSQEQIDLKSC